MASPLHMHRLVHFQLVFAWKPTLISMSTLLSTMQLALGNIIHIILHKTPAFWTLPCWLDFPAPGSFDCASPSEFAASAGQGSATHVGIFELQITDVQANIRKRKSNIVFSGFIHKGTSKSGDKPTTKSRLGFHHMGTPFDTEDKGTAKIVYKDGGQSIRS